MSGRVIITGATGLIGGALAERLVAAGHEVVGLSRDPEGARGVPDGVRLLRWDGRTPEGWAHAVEGAEAIVNLAGATLGKRWTAARKAKILGSRVDATHAVVEAIRGAKDRPKVLVQASAVGYYGPRGPEPLAADAPPGDDFLARVCVAWEAASEPVEELGVRRSIARSGIVLSRRAEAMARLMLPIRLFAGGPIAGGRQYLPWIHVDDEAAALHFLLGQERCSGPYNLAAPESMTQGGFVRTAARVLGRPAVVPTPGFALKLVLGEMATLVVDGQNAVPDRLIRDGFEFRFPTLEPALQNLLG